MEGKQNYWTKIAEECYSGEMGVLKNNLEAWLKNVDVDLCHINMVAIVESVEDGTPFFANLLVEYLKNGGKPSWAKSIVRLLLSKLPNLNNESFVDGPGTHQKNSFETSSRNKIPPENSNETTITQVSQKPNVCNGTNQKILHLYQIYSELVIATGKLEVDCEQEQLDAIRSLSTAAEKLRLVFPNPLGTGIDSFEKTVYKDTKIFYDFETTYDQLSKLYRSSFPNTSNGVDMDQEDDIEDLVGNRNIREGERDQTSNILKGGNEEVGAKSEKSEFISEKTNKKANAKPLKNGLFFCNDVIISNEAGSDSRWLILCLCTKHSDEKWTENHLTEYLNAAMSCGVLYFVHSKTSGFERKGPLAKNAGDTKIGLQPCLPVKVFATNALTALACSEAGRLSKKEIDPLDKIMKEITFLHLSGNKSPKQQFRDDHTSIEEMVHRFISLANRHAVTMETQNIPKNVPKHPLVALRTQKENTVPHAPHSNPTARKPKPTPRSTKNQVSHQSTTSSTLAGAVPTSTSTVLDNQISLRNLIQVTLEEQWKALEDQLSTWILTSLTMKNVSNLRNIFESWVQNQTQIQLTKCSSDPKIVSKTIRQAAESTYGPVLDEIVNGLDSVCHIFSSNLQSQAFNIDKMKNLMSKERKRIATENQREESLKLLLLGLKRLHVVVMENSQQQIDDVAIDFEALTMRRIDQFYNEQMQQWFSFRTPRDPSVILKFHESLASMLAKAYNSIIGKTENLGENKIRLSKTLGDSYNKIFVINLDALENSQKKVKEFVKRHQTDYEKNMDLLLKKHPSGLDSKILETQHNDFMTQAQNKLLKSLKDESGFSEPSSKHLVTLLQHIQKAYSTFKEDNENMLLESKVKSESS